MTTDQQHKPRRLTTTPPGQRRPTDVVGDLWKLIEKLKTERKELKDYVEQLEAEIADLRNLNFGDVRYIRARFPQFTRQECTLFSCLANKKGLLAHHEEIYAALFSGRFDSPSPEIIKLTICRLRKKIADEKFYIESIWGSGYRLVGYE